MNYEDIKYFEPVNAVKEDKVAELVKSITENGWVGCPILTVGDKLFTGSHRFAALQQIEKLAEGACWENDESYERLSEILDDDNICEDITEIVVTKLAENNMEYDDIDFSSIGWLLAGTEYESYKEEIAEW